MDQMVSLKGQPTQGNQSRHGQRIDRGSMGVGRGVFSPWNFNFDIFLSEFYQKKVVLLVSTGENKISPLLAPLRKSFWLHLDKVL